MNGKLKCIPALMLVLALLIPQRVSAAGKLTVTTVSGEKGERVAIEILLTGDDVCSGNFDVCYDSEVLTLVSTETGEGNWLGTANEIRHGTVRVGFAQTTPLTNAVLCRLIFEVLDTTPASGTAITIANARLYNENAKPTEVRLSFGSVSRDCVWYTLKNADTVEGQGVRAEVHMSGTMQPCGGNFVLTYNPDILHVTGILPLDGVNNSQMTYNLDEPGIVRIAFAGSRPVSPGALCAVLFRAVGTAGTTAAVELSEVRAYDEDALPMDTEVSSGEISIVLPTEADPKLWVVGGAIDENGSASASIVLQGRGKVCGGQATLLYDNAMDVEIHAERGVEYHQEEGAIHLSWARETPASEAEMLLTVTFPEAIECPLTFDSNVRVYNSDSERIGVVDIRPGAISTGERLHVTVEEVIVETEEEKSEVSITVDLADAAFFSVEEKTETVTPMLALYKNGQLIGIDVPKPTRLDNGVAELSLSAEADTAITDYAVFFAGDDTMPLCTALCPEE